jgi:hypothetical protein
MSQHPADITAERILRHCYAYTDRLTEEEMNALTEARDVLIGISFEDRLIAPQPEADELALF